jgi:hypothetical protein
MWLAVAHMRGHALTLMENLDYHIQFDRSFYSVPYQLARQTVEVRATPTTIAMSQLCAFLLRLFEGF